MIRAYCDFIHERTAQCRSPREKQCMPSTRAFEAYLLVYVYIRCFAAFSKKRKKEEEEEEEEEEEIT